MSDKDINQGDEGPYQEMGRHDKTGLTSGDDRYRP
jgi:hypothetical protein